MSALFRVVAGMAVTLAIGFTVYFILRMASFLLTHDY